MVLNVVTDQDNEILLLMWWLCDYALCKNVLNLTQLCEETEKDSRILAEGNIGYE